MNGSSSVIEAYHLQKEECAIQDRDEMTRLLKAGRYAVIALCRNNVPYITTLSYGYDESRHALYFHSAINGLKLEILQENPAVCATVIEDRGYQAGECAHAYRSVLLFGRMHRCTTLEEKKHGMNIMLEQLEENPEPIRQRSLASEKVYQRTAILKLAIDEMTGKEGS